MVINMWYSVAVTIQQSILFSNFFVESLAGEKSPFKNMRDKVNQNESLQAHFKDSTIKFLGQMLMTQRSENVNLPSVMKERDAKFNREWSEIYSVYGEQKPEYRESLLSFRKSGIMMPMNINHNALVCPNPFLLHPEHYWVVLQNSDPLHGWPMRKILSSNNPYDVPPNDLYGRLYFYLVEKLKLLVSSFTRSRYFSKCTARTLSI